jgi:hypothetical protein
VVVGRAVLASVIVDTTGEGRDGVADRRRLLRHHGVTGVRDDHDGDAVAQHRLQHGREATRSDCVGLGLQAEDELAG